MTNLVKFDTTRHLNDHYGFEHLNPMIAVRGLKLRRQYNETAVNLPIYETAFNYDGLVLVIHGTHDRVVPYTYGERYNQGCRHSAIKLIPGEDHGFSVNTSEAEFYASDWLTMQLQSGK